MRQAEFVQQMEEMGWVPIEWEATRLEFSAPIEEYALFENDFDTMWIVKDFIDLAVSYEGVRLWYINADQRNVVVGVDTFPGDGWSTTQNDEFPYEV